MSDKTARIISSPELMQEFSTSKFVEGKRIAFVPTMGALHEGHLSLVAEAKKRGDIVVVSIFVNPTQFGENEDFNEYVRDFSGDQKKLKSYEVDVVFAPEVDDIYPLDFETKVELPKLQNCLCGLSRPGHFKGVCTVVTKLFNIVKPSLAIFGEKDYQQLKIVQKLVRDLNMNVKIVSMPIVREKDGLAMSSRNKYLSQSERDKALSISKSLVRVKELYRKGYVEISELVESGIKVLNDSGVSDVDYYEIRDGDTLEPVEEAQQGNLVAVAAKIGSTRLIDNIRL